MGRRVTTAVGLASVALLAFAGTASADTDPIGIATNSPGVISGNVVQVPLDLGLDLCGNSINVVGLLNPAVGTLCISQN